MPRYFTLESARRILPEVRRLMAAAMQARAEMAEIRQRVEAFRERVGLLGGVSLGALNEGGWRSIAERAAGQMRRSLEAMEEIGAQVKDLGMGLVDFPTLYRGREVLLCWRMGEPDIAWWHGADEGFQGRKPVDEDFERHHGGAGQGHA